MRTSGDRFQTGSSKDRFDEASQRDVLEIAARLQKYHLETLSAGEVEQAAIEGGMSPEFVREAIRQVSSTPRELGEETEEKTPVTQSEWLVAVLVPLIVFSVMALKYLPKHGFTSLGAFVVVFGLLLLAGLGFFAFIGIRALSRKPVTLPDATKATSVTREQTLLPSVGGVVCHLLAIFTLVTVPFSPDNNPLSQMIFMLLLTPVAGFFSRTPRAAFWKGFAFGVVLALLTGVVGNFKANFWPIWLASGGILYGLLGLLGGFVQSKLRGPTSVAVPYDRTQMLAQLFELQTALEKNQEVRTFLSVDVVGSSVMKAAANELEVEYSFRQYQAWVAEKVRGLGGEVQFTAGDGAMAMFRDAATAATAAKELQTELVVFNTTRSRLATPFSLRCGIAEGRIGLDAQAAIGHIQSPVLDRAAFLQKYAEPGSVVVAKELIATAMPVLGSLRHRELIDGTEVYCWP